MKIELTLACQYRKRSDFKDYGAERGTYDDGKQITATFKISQSKISSKTATRGLSEQNFVKNGQQRQNRGLFEQDFVKQGALDKRL